ncbi:hypothetical protein DFH09DRAFT_473624 [Mycena vulgaris]|nr:hypothetical protein DFH09DRAFT_473624 [Mycena vulgaris]
MHSNASQNKFLGLVGLAFVTIPSLGQQVGCFSAGTYGNCNRFVGAFCSTISTSTIEPGDNIARCFNAGNGQRCDLSILNTVNSPAVPDGTICNTVLDLIAQDCPRGGYAQIGGLPFEFQADPNTGACSLGGLLGN